MNYHTWKLLVDDSKIQSDYFYHVLKGLTVFIEEKAHGASALVHTQKGEMEQFYVPLPSSFQEQQAIAKALSDVDRLIDGLEKLITKKRDIKTATMQQLLTGKTRLPGFGEGKGYKQTELGEIPEDWEVYSFGQLFDISAGGDLVKRAYSGIYDEDHTFPIYANSVFDEGLYGYSSFKMIDGDSITITARGTLGVAFFRPFPFVAIGRLIILQRKVKVDNYLISEIINHSICFANESTGVPQLTAPQVSKYSLVVPAFDEQQAIAQVLSDMDKELEALQSRLNKTKSIKQGMMQELLTGKIRLI